MWSHEVRAWGGEKKNSGKADLSFRLLPLAQHSKSWHPSGLASRVLYSHSGWAAPPLSRSRSVARLFQSPSIALETGQQRLRNKMEITLRGPVTACLRAILP